ncbi:uncharacterized protein PODANS_1_19380 [Podospora anserina S mat+]|uniref:Podospora anserina S mat+ genomic DNA chromosome 1, supercontig 4 n=2 Tax=Podospora anserina TaxID=2587412 RepID=B2AUK1_PODAN|nr:uncharacterized protein PODANS_1_19380 [Podospora anserina S mat+]CAP68074.1 unnamed protein product [Podospora anserina S mat+]CDN29858.1 Putative protein of unknown function [Podospora anserina]CDP24330.1 Putative protein of unknown function [Podospora anserina S mat+]
MERAMCRAASTYKALIPPLLSKAYNTRPAAKSWKPSVFKQANLPIALSWDPSQPVKDFAAAHKIESSEAVKTIPKQTRLTILRVQACRRHAFDHQHEPYLQPQEHPLTKKILWRCYEWKLNRPLWLYATATTNDGSTVVMRRQAECRTLAAIKAVIKANGFDSDGTALDGSGRVLYGTINLVIWSPKTLLNFEWNDLVEYLAGLVKTQILPSYVKMPGYTPMDSQRPQTQVPKPQTQRPNSQRPRGRKPEGFTIV